MGAYEIAMLISAIVLILGSIALVVIVLIQSNSAKGLSGAIGGGSETYFGKNKKKSIEKKLLIITIVIAIVFAALSLVICSFQKGDVAFAKIYGYDLDGDGLISEEEKNIYNTYNTKKYINEGWDIDHDGVVSAQEYTNISFYGQFSSGGISDVIEQAHEGHDCEFHNHD